MSSYHSSFSYLGKNSASDFNWIISHFDADSGESETGLSTESIYTPSADGRFRNLYGVKYSAPQPIRITVIKQDNSDFSIDDNRQALKWLTGAPMDSWLDLYIGDEVKYRIKGHVQNVLQYKMDARIIGLIIVFEPASPFAHSSLQQISQTTSGAGDGTEIIINNESDDVYGYTYMRTTYTQSTAAGTLIITNTTTGEETRVRNLAINETITIDGNQMITSDNTVRVFGVDFNFVFPRLVAGENKLVVKSTGNITFEYYYAIKIGDMAIDINAALDQGCNSN